MNKIIGVTIVTKEYRPMTSGDIGFLFTVAV